MITIPAIAGRTALEAQAVVALVRAGMIGLDSPRVSLGSLIALQRYGPFGSAPRIAALKHAQGGG